MADRAQHTATWEKINMQNTIEQREKITPSIRQHMLKTPMTYRELWFHACDVKLMIDVFFPTC